jgi:zinc-ribbon domain
VASFCGKCGSPHSPGAQFCPKCGNRLAPSAVATAVRPRVAAPSYPVVAQPGPAPVAGANPTRAFPWLIAGGAVAGLIAAFTVISVLIVPKPATCGETVICPHPSPVKLPLANPNHYESKTFHYVLEYFDQGPLTDDHGKALPRSVENDTSIGWELQGTSGGVIYPITFTGEGANHRSAAQVVEQIQAKSYPNATLAYHIPGAEMGYNDGYGNVYDIRFAVAGGESARRRLIVIAAVKNGLAVELVSVGPFRASNYKDDLHPNPANTKIVNYFDDIVNTVRFPGDPPL